MQKLLYIDTNVLNKLAYIENNEFIFNRIKEHGHYMCISEVTIFEILRDQKDLYNIDKITKMLQNIDELIILPSLGNIVYSYLSHQPIDEKNDNQLIQEVLDNKDLEFKVLGGQNLLENYKKIYKGFNKYVKSKYDDEECKNCKQYYCNNKIDELSMFFAGVFLIAEFQVIEKNNIDKFWKSIKIKKQEDKIDYMNKNVEYLIDENSPFRSMARMYANQMPHINNGTFNDCLHTVYCGMVDGIISNDENFIKIFNCGMNLDEYLQTIDIKLSVM